MVYDLDTMAISGHHGKLWKILEANHLPQMFIFFTQDIDIDDWHDGKRTTRAQLVRR